MGKFIVTGLHSSVKSAFIRSFANDNDAKLFKNISQAQRSTRFIAEYCFEKECELSIEVTFKSRERVEEEVFENLVNSILQKKQADELGGDEDKINELLKEEIEGKKSEELIKCVLLNSVSNFLNLGEFVPLILKQEDYSDITDSVDYTKNCEYIIKKIIGDVYSLCVKKIRERMGIPSGNRTLIIDKTSCLLWDNKNSEANTDFEKNIEMLFRVPDVEDYYADSEYDDPFFSGIVETIKVHWGINEKLLNNGVPKYDFMSQNGKVFFTLYDSFGLDHAHNANDTKQGEELSRIINVYKSIISSQDIDGVILLGTLSTEVLQSQNARQEEIVPYIVCTNLSENPGLNVIFILNHADKNNKSRDKNGRSKVISEQREKYINCIGGDKYVDSLRNRFSNEYVSRSINNFIDSICLYSAKENSNGYIEQMNTETYEKIDRICRSFSRYGISWNDSLNDCNISQNELQDFVKGISDYINSSIKIISAKKKISNLEDDNKAYKELSDKYRSFIRWNTADALARQWKGKSFGGSYEYTGMALRIGSYSKEVQDVFEIDQHPKNILIKHLMALFNCYCQDKRYYPYTDTPFNDNQNDGNGNRFIFIQKCMYDAIFEFAGREETKGFLAERINSLLGSESITRFDVVAMNNCTTSFSNDGISEVEEVFKNIFEEKVRANYEVFHILAIEDEIRERLLNLLGEKRSEYENSSIREVLAEVTNNIPFPKLANLELPDMLKPKLRDIINDLQIITQ